MNMTKLNARDEVHKRLIINVPLILLIRLELK